MISKSAFAIPLLIVAAAGMNLSTDSAAFASAKRPASSAKGSSLEERNLALVLKFSEIAFNQHDVDAAAAMLTENYVQHNPRVPDGRAGFIQFLKASAAARPNAKSQLLRSAASGDLVWTHVRISDGSGKGDIVLVNIFRVANGKIVEHWDVVQPVPDTAANRNTMF